MLLLASPAAAQMLPGIGGEDARRVVPDPAASPFNSLARVQTELGGRCTGALIGPATVLTAAHCLVSPRSRRMVQPGSVHVLLGYRMGSWVATSRVARYETGAWTVAAHGPTAGDWAVLTLETPLAGPVLPILPMPPVGTPVMLAGYQQDRPEVLLATIGCHIVTSGAVLVHDCAATRGASGAPLLAQGADGAWGIAGIAVSMAADRPIGLAVAATVARTAAKD
ncbi:trypsin-like serine peptidase [Humitalea rosea]|uniref:trypsin-like serine peptidase n=1 Tax=Humitalea rosea TaxID=990373 RepID=UPI0013148D30|nr:trypsin-like peptidase domain-containing protein [Humitalea rosea]